MESDAHNLCPLQVTYNEQIALLLSLRLQSIFISRSPFLNSASMLFVGQKIIVDSTTKPTISMQMNLYGSGRCEQLPDASSAAYPK